MSSTTPTTVLHAPAVPWNEILSRWPIGDVPGQCRRANPALMTTSFEAVLVSVIGRPATMRAPTVLNHPYPTLLTGMKVVVPGGGGVSPCTSRSPMLADHCASSRLLTAVDWT